MLSRASFCVAGIVAALGLAACGGSSTTTVVSPGSTTSSTSSTTSSTSTTPESTTSSTSTSTTSNLSANASPRDRAQVIYDCLKQNGDFSQVKISANKLPYQVSANTPNGRYFTVGSWENKTEVSNIVKSLQNNHPAPDVYTAGLTVIAFVGKATESDRSPIEDCLRAAGQLQ